MGSLGSLDGSYLSSKRETLPSAQAFRGINKENARKCKFSGLSLTGMNASE